MDKINKLKDDSLFMSDEERLEWEEWEYNSRMAYATEQGLEQGMKQGMKQGIEQGIEQGTRLGIEKNTIEMIKSMVKNNADYNFISKVTNKSIEEIEKIIKLDDK